MRKTLVTLLLLSLLLSIFAPSISAAEKQDTWLFDEMFTFRMMRPEVSNQPFPKENPVLKEIKEKYGVDIKLELVPTDYDEKVKTLIASGDMPEVMIVGRSAIAVNMQGHGQFLKVSDYFDIMPNYLERQKSNPNFERLATSDGSHYYLQPATVFRYTGATAPAIRKDIFEETGLPMPENYDELYTLLKKIKELHPDTFPISSRWDYSRIFDTMAYPMGSGSRMYYEPRLDKWVYGWVAEDFKEVVQYFHNLYADGILDPDYSINESTNFRERYSSGVSSFHFENGSFLFNYNAVLPEESKFIPMELPKNKYGEQRQIGWGLFNYDDAVIVSIDAEEPEKIMKVLDWFFSPEGIELTNWGKEGETFFINADSERELIPEYVAQFASATDPWRSFMASWGFGQLGIAMVVDELTAEPFIDDEAKSFYKFWADRQYTDPIMEPSFTGEELEEIGEITAAIEMIIAPQLEGMVTGSVSIDTFEAVAQQVKDAGATRLEEIYNNAEQRMKNN